MAVKVRWFVITLLLACAGYVWFYRSSVYNNQPIVTDRPKLVVISGGNGPYWQLLCRGAEAAGKEFGAEVELLSPVKNENTAEQTKILTTLDLEGVDGIALSPLDAETQTRLINRVAEDVFVVTVDSDAPLSNRISYVGASNYGAGLLCGKLVQEAMPEGGKVCVLMANLSKHNTIERKRGLEEQLLESTEPNNSSHPGFELSQVLIDEGDRQRCYDQLSEFLADGVDVGCIVGMNSHHGGQMLKALGDSELLGKVTLVSFDTEEETLSGVEAGHIYATIAQNPYLYGYEAIRNLGDYCRWDEAKLPLIGVQSTVVISTKAIRKEDVADLRRDYTQLMRADADSDQKSAKRVE